MKGIASTGTRRQARSRNAIRAFTLTEIMVTMVIFMMVILGTLYAHIFGLRMFEIARAKLGASDEARAAISKLVEEIRTARTVDIGDGGQAFFDEIPADTPQVGTAIQIYPTTDTNVFIRYYWDEVDNRLKRTEDGSSAVLVVANSIRNQQVFSSEDHLGNVITNNQNNRVIGLTLEFYQLLYPNIQIGPGQYYDFYQLRTKITRRALE